MFMDNSIAACAQSRLHSLETLLYYSFIGIINSNWLLSLLALFVFFFFFQAEDGIRDWSVTGVQTCALPISELKNRLRRACDHGHAVLREAVLQFRQLQDAGDLGVQLDDHFAWRRGRHEIGRASCRERV